MSRTSRLGRSHPGPEWRISHRATRTDWSDAVERCATCRTDIDMRETHYQVVLDRDIDHSGKLTFERQRVVFCDEACANRWESHA